MIGEKAGYARQAFVEKVLPYMIKGWIDNNELVAVRDIDGDGIDNAIEINKGSNILDRYNKLPPSVEALEILNDELYAVVAGNDELSYAFNLQNWKTLLRELREAPYREELKFRITTADPKENVSEAWNYKVRREDEVLCEIIPEHQRFDCNSAEAIQFRFDNGSYHLTSWIEYRKTGDINNIHILPLDNDGLREWFENKKDEEYAMMQMWVPDAMHRYDITKWQFIVMDYAGTRKPIMPFEALRNNMDVILGGKKINAEKGIWGKKVVKGGLPFKDLRDRIVRVNDNHSLKSYPRSQVYGTDYEHGIANWDRQTGPIVQLNLREVPDSYRTTVMPVLEKWKEFELIKLAYGLGVLDMDDYESSDTKMAQIYTKSLGHVMMEQLGRAPTDIGSHQYAALVMPKKILQQLPSRIIVYRGQSISPYSMEEGLKKDGVGYVREPNGSKIVWRLYTN